MINEALDVFEDVLVYLFFRSRWFEREEEFFEGCGNNFVDSLDQFLHVSPWGTDLRNIRVKGQILGVSNAVRN